MLPRLTSALILAALATTPAAAASCEVGMSQYHAVKSGMTIAQANAAVGCPGEETVRTSIGNFEVVSYLWMNPATFAMLIIVTNNGKVASKTQSGLK